MNKLKILRNLTGILKTCYWEELSQFLGRYLIKGLHLRTFMVKRILGEEHIVKKDTWKSFLDIWKKKIISHFRYLKK